VARDGEGRIWACRRESPCACGGGEPGDGKGAFYPPTVLAKVENRMDVAQEEIFGPVVTAIPFESARRAFVTRMGVGTFPR